VNTVSTQKRRYELKARAEAQQATRERIAAAAVALHQDVGIAKTTVADIARRAGVQRLTVYNHFPDPGGSSPPAPRTGCPSTRGPTWRRRSRSTIRRTACARH
jgi:hypothetical protein